MKSSYKRVLLKLSGESLMAPEGYGIDSQVIAGISEEIKDLTTLGVQIAIVIGGGNIFRGGGGEKAGIDRATGDYMG
ncbi:MAG TPA: UMP kinase, partial [Deltaproteobacteria bacterium]|nr:UMP kinase [Deltaproteobacteria bacterium]